MCSPVCRRMAEQGADVVVADLKQDKAEQLAMSISDDIPGARVKWIHADTDDEQSGRAAVQYAVEQFGRLDIMVNATFKSLGSEKTVHSVGLDDLTAEDLDSVLHSNITSAFVLAREAAKAMENGGSIIMFDSIYGMVSPDPRNYPEPMKPSPIEYGMSKAAIVRMVKYLAAYWAPRDIRVNAITPGAFPWPQQQTDNPALIERLEQRIPMGRIGRQDEIAGAVTFLASDEASYVTGHTLVADGGYTLL